MNCCIIQQKFSSDPKYIHDGFSCRPIRVFFPFFLSCRCCHRAQALEYKFHHLRRRRAPARPASTPSLHQLRRRTSRTTPTTRTLDSTTPETFLTTRASPHRHSGLSSHRADSKFSFTFTHLRLHSSFAIVTSADVERKLSGASYHRRRWVAAYPPAQHHPHSHFTSLNPLRTLHFAHLTTSHIASHITSHHTSHRIGASLRRIPLSLISLLTVHSSIHSFHTLASSRLRGEDRLRPIVELLQARRASARQGNFINLHPLMLWVRGNVTAECCMFISTLQHSGYSSRMERTGTSPPDRDVDIASCFGCGGMLQQNAVCLFPPCIISAVITDGAGRDITAGPGRRHHALLPEI